MELNLKNTFTDALPSDPELGNYVRQVKGATHSFVAPKIPANPSLIHANPEMAMALGLTEAQTKSNTFLNVFSGKTVYPNTKPYAMAYAGHQFGNWAGQLGDGRAINLFEVEHKNKLWAVQLKGSGKTPYSRQGDGLAVLRSSIREYLCSEAMHHLGVPTTRVLSLMLSGEDVLRDMLYDGNADYEKGAIVARVAPSFIRFGNFELFASRQDHKTLKQLVDYTIQNFYPELENTSDNKYLAFFEAVTHRTLEMIIHWQRVGFVHGVMNTDNMSILGLTIDYGPYGWLDDFNFGWTPNTTDVQHKRYRFGNQPNMALYNLIQLANALYPLIEDAKPLEKILEHYQNDFERKSLDMMRRKLGLQTNNEEDIKLIAQLEELLHEHETDMTIFFRLLSNYKKGSAEDGIQIIADAFYNPEALSEATSKKWKVWFKAYDQRLKNEQVTDEERKKAMNAVNPKYVLRNYMAQLAIDDADKRDYALLEELFEMLKNPYEEQPEYEQWFAKRPDWARTRVGCSMLSCSS
ncbi:YdiU family protein [Winogradskyella maritima]|uniref:Protein nucleotidyltransferase YdiU n=1 Tax=Winogradskyella maritima TaxID=1517766 RepID=A0ABV8AJG7_9FLAO|nr:YdiU family protein [Winogradskyella maritima]